MEGGGVRVINTFEEGSGGDPVGRNAAAAASSSSSSGGGVLQRRYGETTLIRDSASAKGRTIVIHPSGARSVLTAAARRYVGAGSDAGRKHEATFRKPSEVGVRSSTDAVNLIPTHTQPEVTSPSRLPRPRQRGANFPSMLAPASVFDPDPPQTKPAATVSAATSNTDKVMHGLVSGKTKITFFSSSFC